MNGGLVHSASRREGVFKAGLKSSLPASATLA